jgi:hypothetical protein
VSAIVFLDTETTGLSLDDDIWEFAAIRREEDGTEAVWHLFIEHSVTKCNRLPEPFRADHANRYDPALAWRREEAAEHVAVLFTGRPHVVGAVPNFDTERLARLLLRLDLVPGWHYHLIDVENLAVGYLAGRASMGDLDAGLAMPDLPWDSDVLSRACGVEPPTKDRHTAMGDARWAMALYDAIMGGGAQ